MALLVCRQTDYSPAEAERRLEQNDWDPVVVIRGYLNPDSVRRETSRNTRKSTNQRIYGEIGKLMEIRNRNDEKRQANGEPSQVAQDQVGRTRIRYAGRYPRRQSSCRTALDIL